MAAAYETPNAQANELLYRRVDIEDVVSAHLLALEKAPQIRFGRYIISATTPFSPGDLAQLRRNAPEVVSRLFADFRQLYKQKNWTMFPQLDRVYVNQLARAQLGWRPRYDFRHVLESLRAQKDFRSPLALQVGSKGYHPAALATDP
jgi:UDP-glucose 4-epimerase